MRSNDSNPEQREVSLGSVDKLIEIVMSSLDIVSYIFLGQNKYQYCVELIFNRL